MKRRTVLQGIGAALAAPRIAAAQAARVLKFIPQSDLTVLDPIWTTAYVTRNHGFMVFDTLFGSDGSFKASPQMAAGMTVESDGKLVRITLRDGLKWHDGEKVLARDCAASIKRWGARDSFGQTVMAVTDELSAPDDKTIQFRLKKPFALLADALGKSSSNFAAMMPERLALTDPFKQITEMVGSGPYKFKADERNVGHLVVYERNAAYVPSPTGTASWTAGPKIANFDRVEWHVIPDPSTAAAALQGGEMDWWETPTGDLLPTLRKAGITVAIQDPTGLIGCMRFNQLQPPFDNPAIRRAILGAISQEDFNLTIAGDDPAMSRTGVGVFTPGTPLASDVGLEPLIGKRDYDKVKRDLAAAGYKGEKVVFLAPTDLAVLKMQGDIAGDALKRAGLNVEVQAMDWGSVVGRRTNKGPIDKGGWNVACTFWTGGDHLTPAGHTFMRGTGEAGGNWGWPSSTVLEDLRTQWFDAPGLAAQQKLAQAMQRQVMQDVPYVPLGQVLQATAFRKNITGVPNGFAMFWNVRKG